MLSTQSLVKNNGSGPSRLHDVPDEVDDHTRFSIVLPSPPLVRDRHPSSYLSTKKRSVCRVAAWLAASWCGKNKDKA